MDINQHRKQIEPSLVDVALVLIRNACEARQVILRIDFLGHTLSIVQQVTRREKPATPNALPNFTSLL